MATEHLIFLSVPGLRHADISPTTTPTLYGWANAGGLAELVPTFPCVTSCVQASMWTGAGPGEHGVIANGFYHRDRHEVEFWVGRNGVVGGEQIWDTVKRLRPEFVSAVWHAQNIKDAAADFIVTPEPIHEPDGTTKLWCYSKPEGLYQRLLADLGHFPLQHYWGPLANIESTKWILKAAGWLIERHSPNLHWIYVPHLDYAAQKFGPNCPPAQAALMELDRCLGEFAERIGRLPGGRDATFLVVGEYALTDVSGVVYPNRILREAGLLRVRENDGREELDLAGSDAFAMVDHQFAHVFVRGTNDAARTRNTQRVVDLFRGHPGIADVAAGGERQRLGMMHARSGDVVLVCDDAHWLAYYWWLDDAAAPAFAQTVDIHRKPGYDPVELFFDPKTRGIPLDAMLVKGTHGAPCTTPNQRAALIVSRPNDLVRSGRAYRDTDIKALTLGLLGL